VSVCLSRSCIMSNRSSIRPLLLNLNRKLYQDFRMVPFSIALNDSNHEFKVTKLFDVVSPKR